MGKRARATPHPLPTLWTVDRQVLPWLPARQPCWHELEAAAAAVKDGPAGGRAWSEVHTVGGAARPCKASGRPGLVSGGHVINGQRRAMTWLWGGGAVPISVLADFRGVSTQLRPNR